MLTLHEEEVLKELLHRPPLEVYKRRIAANDERIRGPELDNGRDIALERTAIHTGLVAHWAAEQHRESGYKRPFAVAAVGGTGRGEMTPCSDTDFVLLVDDAVEGNAFIRRLQEQTIDTGDFARHHGFTCGSLPFNLDDLETLDQKQLNAFIDMRPVHNPDGLAERFARRLRANHDPLHHFLFIRGMWEELAERKGYDSERLDSFDVKMNGLRVFLAGIWAMAGKEFVASREIYQLLGDSRDLDAYYFLLRIRAFVNSRRGTCNRPTSTGKHDEDVLAFEDFTAFGEMLPPEADERARFRFANKVRARLLSARRRVARFSVGVMGRELRLGREVSPGSPIIYGAAGLRYTGVDQKAPVEEKSQRALSLLLASQRYELPIDPTELDRTFHEAGDWLKQTPEVADLFLETNGSLADSFAFLAQLDGAENRLFPGYAEFEVSMDERVMTEKSALRGSMVLTKIRTLEDWRKAGRETLARELKSPGSHGVQEAERDPVEVALLDDEEVAAVKLALKTKRLPLTPDDTALSEDVSLPLHERYASGFSRIGLQDYYAHSLQGCEFSPEMLELTEFLVQNRRAFKGAAEDGPNDTKKVRDFAALCGTEPRLRALFVFTAVDRAEWESDQTDATRWFVIRELYGKVLATFRPSRDPEEVLKSSGYSEEELEVLSDFGKALFGGSYAGFGIQFGEHLAQIALAEETPGPKARLLRKGASTILAVAAKDSRGLAASISGALWHAGVTLRQAHFFSSTHHRLALNFFHLEASRANPLPNGLTDIVVEAIEKQQHVGEAETVPLPPDTTTAVLVPWHSNFRLSAETSVDAGGLLYALTYHVYRSFGANVQSLGVSTGKTGAVEVAIYHSKPRGMDLGKAQAIAERGFRPETG